MQDPRVDALARVIVEYSTEVRKGDRVAIHGSAAATPMLLALYAKTLDAGAFPDLFVSLEGQAEVFWEHALDVHLDRTSPLLTWAVEEFDVRISMSAPYNQRESSAVDPARKAQQSRSTKDVFARIMERSAAGEIRWVTFNYPTHALASDAEMGLLEYERFLFRACLVDRPDPVAAWRDLRDRNRRLQERLASSEELHIVGPGTDLRVAVTGRTWIAASGENNIPDGEVFTSPLETSANGVIAFDLPTVYGGREVRDIRLRFEDGVVVDASAGHNEEWLVATLDTDEGARRLGEVAIGTNFGINRGTRSILFDEKIGGTVHLAVGHGFPECGSDNESAVHWDMICDLRAGGRVDVDGETILEDGVFRDARLAVGIEA